MKKNQGVWIVVAIILIATIALFVRQRGILLAPKTGDLGSTNGEDICPNPTSSYTACIGELACSCKNIHGGDLEWTAPVGKTCKETALDLCDSATISQGSRINDLSSACVIAEHRTGEPGQCTSSCIDKDTLTHESKTSSCCTKTKERNCVPKVSGIAIR